MVLSTAFCVLMYVWHENDKKVMFKHENDKKLVFKKGFTGKTPLKHYFLKDFESF